MAEIALKNVSTGLTVNGRYYSVAELKNATLVLGEGGNDEEQGGDGDNDGEQDEEAQVPDQPYWTLFNPAKQRNEYVIFEPEYDGWHWQFKAEAQRQGRFTVEQRYSPKYDQNVNALVFEEEIEDSIFGIEGYDASLIVPNDIFRNVTSGTTYGLELLEDVSTSEIMNLWRKNGSNTVFEYELQCRPNSAIEQLRQDTPMVVVLKFSLFE